MDVLTTRVRAHGRRTRARTHTHRAAAKRRVPPSPPATLSPSYHSGGATQHEGEAHERRTICCAGATHPPTHCAVSETGTEHLDGVTSLLMRQWPSPRAPTPAGWGRDDDSLVHSVAPSENIQCSKGQKRWNRL